MRTKVKIKEREFEVLVARANLNYLQLAEKCGVNKVYLSNVKNENLPHCRPSAKLRDKLVEILNVKFDDIFEIEE